TILKDYLHAVRRSAAARRAYVRVEPTAGERCDVDWGHFDALAYNGAMRKLYAFCLVESHSRKMYLEFTHSQNFESFARCHIHAFQYLGGVSQEIWYDFVPGNKIVLLWRVALCGANLQELRRIDPSGDNRAHNGWAL